MDEMEYDILTEKFTRDDYLALPEGFPAQLLRGQLVKEPSPTPWHQALVWRVGSALERLVGRNRIVISPIDCFLDEENIFQPDVAVLPEGSRLGPDLSEIPTPILVVEVLSPATAERDRDEKTGIYLDRGVTEVWLVDPIARTIERVPPAGPAGPLKSTVVPGFPPDPETLFGE